MKSKKPVKNRYKGALRPGSENYMYGGYQYMYGGEYKAGGTLQDIGSFAYGTLEGIVDPLTGNLLDPLTDKGFEELQKLGNKNIDLTDEKDLKEIEKQNKLRGSGEIAGAITAGVINPASAVSAVGTGLEGANRIIQNSDVSDKTRQIANISTQIGSTATGIASGSGLAEGIAPFAKTADQLDNWMNIGKAVQVGSQFLPQGNDLASQARAIQAENDAIAGLYPDANVQYYGKGGKLGNKIGNLRREGYPQDQAVAIAYSMQERNELGNGGYVVSKSDRKGKTHKVTGPDGTVKHFGDPNLKNRPNNPKAKKSWYARHKKNLDNNPHFRAYARATWAEGGLIDTDPKDKKKIDTSTPLSFIKSAAEYRGITPEQFIDLAEKIGIHESINLDPKRIQELDSGRTGKGRGVYQFEPASAESALVRFEEILKKNNNGVIPEWANELYNYDSIPELTTLMQTVLAAADLSEKENFILKKAVESDEALAEQWGIGWQTENDPVKKKRFLENIQSDRAKKLQGSLMKTLQAENKAYESSTEAEPIKVDSATTTTSMQTHTVAPGETFYGIANKYNINKDSLVKANPNIKSIHSIQIGQDINIPSQKAMGGMIDKNVMMQDLYGKGGKIRKGRKIRKKKKMIKRADGSYSERGLWDNIRAARGSGKKPTKEMLKQERKIKAEEKAMGGEMYAQGGDMSKKNPIQKYNDYKSYVEKARQAIGTNDTKLLKELGGSRPYDNNDLARDFGELQRLRKEAGLGISEEAQILFPHIGQQMRGTLNQWFGTNYAQGGSFDNPGFKALPKEVQMQIMANTNAYGGEMYANGGSFDNPGFRALPAEVQAKIKGEAMGYGGKMYAQGGAMDIDPAEAILNAPKGTYSSDIIKKARVAKNFAKAYGGNMYAYGGELPYSFEMGGEMLQTIDNGGTHEQNPNGGVPATPDGMNLVEEGETVMNGNFVFSNRLKVTPEVAREFNLGKKAVGKTYADVSKTYKDEERPNDRFINRANERTLENLAEAQESYKAVEQAKYQQTNQELQQAMQMQQMQDMMGQQMGAPMNEQQMMQQMMQQQMAQGQMPQQGMPQQQMGYGGKMMYFEGGDMPNPEVTPEGTPEARSIDNYYATSPNNPNYGRYGQGTRTNIDGTPRNHSGIDIKASKGDPLYAHADGIVQAVVNRVGAGEQGSSGQETGNYVIISYTGNDGQTYYAKYAHLDEVNTNLQPGDPIKAGESFGKAGNTGNAYNLPAEQNHVHIEVSPDGSFYPGKGKSFTDADSRIDPTTVFGYNDVIGLLGKELEQPAEDIKLSPSVEEKGETQTGNESVPISAETNNLEVSQGPRYQPSRPAIDEVLTFNEGINSFDQSINDVINSSLDVGMVASRGEELQIVQALDRMFSQLPPSVKSNFNIEVEPGGWGAGTVRVTAPGGEQFIMTPSQYKDDQAKLRTDLQNIYNIAANIYSNPEMYSLGMGERPAFLDYTPTGQEPTTPEATTSEATPSPEIATGLAPFGTVPMELLPEALNQYNTDQLKNGYTPLLQGPLENVDTEQPAGDENLSEEERKKKRAYNYATALQYAPIATNAAGMIQAMIDRPDYIQPEQTNVDFTYTPMDMTQARADAATAMRTGMRGAAAGSRGSVGSYMDATERITGATARGLGQTAMQQDLYNRQQQMQSRQQQFQQAAQNAQQRAMATQFNQQSDAARTDRILEMMMGMGQNLGEIGTRALYGDQAGKIAGYDIKGNKITNTTDNGG